MIGMALAWIVQPSRSVRQQGEEAVCRLALLTLQTDVQRVQTPAKKARFKRSQKARF
jgi:hypothetical protein